MMQREITISQTNMKKLQNENINTKKYWDLVFSGEIKAGTERLEPERFEKTAQMVCDNSLVLDAGCGRGEFVKYLKECRPGCKIMGVDISEIGINDAKKRIPNCEFKTMDVYDIPKVFKEYDYIISFETIEHLSRPVDFIKGLWHSLKKSGCVIITLPFENMVCGGVEHIYSYDFQDMLNFLQRPDWEIIILIRYSKNLKNMCVVAKKL